METGVSEPVPWDWRDILAWFPLSFALLLVLVGIEHGYPAIDPLRIADQSVAHVVGALTQYLPFVAATLGLALVHRKASWAQLGWRLPSVRWLLATPLLAVGMLLTTYPVGFLINHLFPHAVNPQVEVTKAAFSGSPVLGLVAVSLLAPLAEETVFRGFFFGWLKRRLPVSLSVLISALLFTAAHWIAVISLQLVVVGVVLALIYQRSKSLLPGILVHAMFNAYGLVCILGYRCPIS
jgi:membrane protease YdiL (CAAX protease family)